MVVTHEGGPVESEWRSAVTVRTDPELASEIEERFAHQSGLRSVAVTDLLAPRKAFWRAVAPGVPVSVERQARLDAGRLLHRVLGSVWAREGRLEVRVRKDGIVGRVDILADVPIEVKTGAAAVEAEELLRSRPEYVEQLGMYCALLERTAGRLLVLRVSTNGVEQVRAADVTYRDLHRIGLEMQEVAAALRSGWAASRADRLPRCRWFDRGCEFRAEGVCDCTGNEPAPPSPILAEVVAVEGRPDVDRRLLPALTTESFASSVSSIGRFRDLVYPRRAYFDRLAPALVEPAAAPAPVLPDLYRRILEAVESGPVGEVTRLPTLADEPAEEVEAFRSRPYLVRTSRARNPPQADEIVTRFPQYALELGFRCAVTGTSSGRVIIGYEHAAGDAYRLCVFDFRFAPVTAFARLWRERASALKRAVKERSPDRLAPCPEWMYAQCPYRDACACGSGPVRSQR